ncbi:universal stress protein [Geodermatophilus sp. SYSU D00742]
MTGPTTVAGRRVVAGVDGSESSVGAAVYAAGAAHRRGLPLLLVHVTPWQAAGQPRPMSAPEVRSRFHDSATHLVEAAADAVRRSTGMTEVSASVVDDHPVDGLLALSAEAALLVIGRRGLGGVPGLLLGSTAGAVVQHARCPVIALPDEPGDADRRHSVVAGVEGRPGDEEVLAFAVAEAASRTTGLTAVHAWRDVTLEAAVGGFGPLVDWTGVEDEERRLLAEAVAGWRDEAPDVELREVVVRDRPSTALLTAATTAELLVVGHRQRSWVARLGSTTHGVLHRASCPVAVVPLRA